MIKYLLAFISIIGLVSCTKGSSKPEPVVRPAPSIQLDDSSTSDKATKTIIESAISQDPQDSPCDNFYQFACGGWIKSFELPENRASYSMKGSTLEDQFLLKMINLLKTESEQKTPLGILYKSCVNRDDSILASKKQLQELMLPILQMQTIDDLPAVLGRLQRYGVAAFFTLSTSASFSNSKINGAHLAQDPFSLPEKDFYVSNDSDKIDLRKQYLLHIEKTFELSQLFDELNVAQRAQQILDLETDLAKHALANSEAFDPVQANHPITLAEIRTTLNWNWDVYFENLGLVIRPDLESQKNQQWNLDSPNYLNYLFDRFHKMNIDELKSYLLWKVLLFTSPQIGGELQNESFHFWKSILRGQKKPSPRERECLRSLESIAADNISVLFLKNYPEAIQVQKAGRDFVEDIKISFLENLQSISWLSEKTKVQIKDKIQKMRSLISFADHYLPVDLSTVADNQYLHNYLALSKIKIDFNLEQLGKPVDETKWELQPYQDNAYYSRESNLIVLPYLNFVPPYFDQQGSQAANFGSISYVAHELTHGFDASGSLYDADGNVRRIWSDPEYTKFNELNLCYIDQANQYKVTQGYFLNGEQILDENIADQGGLKMAFLAYKKLEAKKAESKKLQGHSIDETTKNIRWTSDQQFFLAYAQTWCIKETDASIKNQIDSDEHAPNEFRVNGVVMNRPEFASAFHCAVGSKLNPIKRCETW